MRKRVGGGRLGRGAVVDHVLVQGPVGVDRHRNVARVDVAARFVRLRHLVRGTEFRDDFGVVPLRRDLVGQRVPTRLEHLGHEPIERGEGRGRIVGELLLKRLPFAFPLVSVETGLVHEQLHARRPGMSNHR
ncbi:MAG: hypothetical protein ABI948_10860 [Thermoleophilia bacterium]